MPLEYGQTYLFLMAHILSAVLHGQSSLWSPKLAVIMTFMMLKTSQCIIGIIIDFFNKQAVNLRGVLVYRLMDCTIDGFFYICAKAGVERLSHSVNSHLPSKAPNILYANAQIHYMITQTCIVLVGEMHHSPIQVLLNKQYIVQTLRFTHILTWYTIDQVEFLMLHM